MRLSHQVHYGICGVFDLAYNGHGLPVQVRVVSERQAIPARYLEQIFQRLRRAQLVTSKRGPGGGYTLARPSAEITLRDIVEAVEGPLAETLRPPPPEPEDTGYRPSFLWPDLAERFGAVLEDLTVEDLVREAIRHSVRRAVPHEQMWHI